MSIITLKESNSKKSNRVYSVGLFYNSVVTRYVVGHSSWADVICVTFECTHILFKKFLLNGLLQGKINTSKKFIIDNFTDRTVQINCFSI